MTEGMQFRYGFGGFLFSTLAAIGFAVWHKDIAAGVFVWALQINVWLLVEYAARLLSHKP